VANKIRVITGVISSGRRLKNYAGTLEFRWSAYVA
jgi:hypothetical protein